MAILTTDYVSSEGYEYTLTVDQEYIKSIEMLGGVLEVCFKGETTEHYLSGFVPKSDVEDKRQYRKVDELVTELKGWRKALEENRERYRTTDHSLKWAVLAHDQVEVLTAIIADLENGQAIW